MWRNVPTYVEVSWQLSIYLPLQKKSAHSQLMQGDESTKQDPDLWDFTFNNFGNSLWFDINQLWVAVDGGDLGEVWAWRFPNKRISITLL